MKETENKSLENIKLSLTLSNSHLSFAVFIKWTSLKVFGVFPIFSSLRMFENIIRISSDLRALSSVLDHLIQMLRNMRFGVF